MFRKRDVVLVFAGWTVVALADGMQNAIGAALSGHPTTWLTAYRDAFLNWYACAIFTPILLWLVSRWPLGKTSNASVWLIYTGVIGACTILRFVIWVPVIHALYPNSTATLQSYLTADFVFQFFAFAAVTGVLLAVAYYRSYRERETRAAQLEATLSRAQLDALRVQLQPHFLFNTLNSIAALIYIDPVPADEMLTRLADLLRLTLDRGDAQEVTLEDELETLDHYVDIMRVRLRDRLSVEIAVSAPARMCVVPHFILQPLVENAIEHGVDRVLGRCVVRLCGEVEDGALTVSVSDHGPGLDRDMLSTGIGISNTRRRLQALYGDAAALEIQSANGGGAMVLLRLPAREPQAL